jgi:hypothetical protein
MKHFGKNSISSALRIIIDLSLVMELLAVTVTLWQIFQFLPPLNDSARIMLFVLLSQFIFGIISFLITLQLRKLINAFKKEAFFELTNVKRIQNISLLLFLYVISDLVLSQFNPNQHSIEIISRVIGNIPFITTFLGFAFAINFKILFLSAVIFVISRVFKNGYELKEQTTLTI